MIFHFTLYELLAYFLIYSFLGWCVEVVYAAITYGKIINRGFLNGPVCPIYGFGMLAVLFLLTPLQHNLLLLFLGGMLLPSVLELAAGWVLYNLYHTRWWDYSQRRFNLGGFICLQFALLWGLGTIFMLRVVHPPVALLVRVVPRSLGIGIMVISYLAYAADVVVTGFTAAGLARDLDTLERVTDGLLAISDAMTDRLGNTAMAADQRMDEGRLQFKLAKAEIREAASKLSPREAAAATRRKADEAVEAARRVKANAQLNASEAANAAKLAARGTAERAAERLRLEQLRGELEARLEAMHSQVKRHSLFGPERLLRAYPQMRHGKRSISLDTLRQRLHQYLEEDEDSPEEKHDSE